MIQRRTATQAALSDADLTGDVITIHVLARGGDGDRVGVERQNLRTQACRRGPQKPGGAAQVEPGHPWCDILLDEANTQLCGWVQPCAEGHARVEPQDDI